MVETPNPARLAASTKIGRALTFAKGFYACYYAAGAFLAPFLVLHYRALGFRGAQIGVLRGISPLIAVVGAPLWGALADVTRQHKLVRVGTLVGAWLAVLALSSVERFGIIVACIVGYAAFGAPIIPLVDNAVITLLGTERKRYGQQRMWGAVGWGIAGSIAGVLIERSGMSFAFAGYLVLMACGGVMALGIPAADTFVTETSAEPGDVVPQGSADLEPRLDDGQGANDVVASAFVADLRRLIADRAWLAFLVAIFLGGFFLSVENGYLFLYLDSLGASASLMGLSLAVTTVSELPVWFLAPKLLGRLGARRLLAVALLAGIVQAIAYAWLPNAWLALPVQLLHGLAFSAMWTAGVAYAADAAPPGTAATAQGLYNAVQMGLSAAMGGYLGGTLFESIGGAMTFRLTAVSSALALILVWVGARRRRRVVPVG